MAAPITIPNSIRRTPAPLRLGTLLALTALVFTSCSGIFGSSVSGASNPCAGTYQLNQPSGSGNLGSPANATATPIGPVPSDQVINLNVQLAVNTSALAACEQALYNPQSPVYGHFLTPQQVASEFAPAQQSIDALTQYFTSNGLQVTQTYATNAALSVSGSAQQIEKAFAIQLNVYPKGNTTYYAPNQTPTLPANLQGIIADITGLNTESSVHCNVSGGKSACSYLDTNLHFTKPKQPVSIHTADTPSGDCTLASIGVPIVGGATSPSQQLLTWASLRQAYGLNTLGAAGYDGGSSAIGMVEFDTYDPTDVNNYMLCAGSYAPNRIVNDVVVTGGVAPNSGSGAGEAELDLELASGLTASTTQIIDYYAPNNLQWAASLEDILNKAASDHKVSVLSISYGDYEADMTPTYMMAVNNSLQVLASEGISVFIASGDCGAYGSGQYGEKALSFPASAPWAIAVGGTQLNADPLGNVSSEQAWGNSSPDTTTCQNTWGSGGGVSSVSGFTVPSWQRGAGVENQYSTGLRQVPDVAAAAINISFYYQGLWLAVGGTSAAAPIWAAGIDVVNQDLAAHNKPLFGGVPNIYMLANKHKVAFHDITQGNNQFYSATPGWDYTTGWGSPHFDIIAQALGG